MGYWENRQAKIMYETIEDAEKIASELADIYAKATRKINYDIKNIYDKYMNKHNLTENEAKKLLNSLKNSTDIEELKRALLQNPKKRDILAEIESPAYKARIERLESLQHEIDRMMKEIYNQEKMISSAHYADIASNSYYRGVYEIQKAAGFQFSFSTVDYKMLNQFLSTKWEGANYSTRIWKNTNNLAKELKEQLIIGYLTGKHENDMSKEIANKFGVANYKAKRLVRTESNFQAGQGQLLAFKEAEIEKYQLVAVLDLRISSKCRKIDNKVFYLKDAVVGVNMHPFHPFCRTTSVAYFEDDNLSNLKRRARDPVTGETKLFSADINYEKWYKENVSNNPNAQSIEAMIKNWGSDSKQYERYANILGNKAGKSFADFQDIKYNDIDKFKYVELDYRRRKKLIENPNLKLPNTENIVIPKEKFTKYIFDGENPKGLAKGKAFTSRLGYSIENWEELQKEIKKNAAYYPATLKGNNGYGDMYEQKMILQGKNKKLANVVVGWLKKGGTVNLTSTYIKEVKE